VIDHVTLLSAARIEGRVARDNFTPIVGRAISSGFSVFASGWVLRSAGHGLRFFAPQNAATESGNAGIEIVLGERFPSVKVFGLSLARGGHQTMKRSISIYHRHSKRTGLTAG
jgi:hypothetical protein